MTRIRDRIDWLNFTVENNVFTYCTLYILVVELTGSVVWQDNQKDLEHATEQLSEYLERDITSDMLADIKQKVQDKYRWHVHIVHTSCHMRHQHEFNGAVTRDENRTERTVLEPTFWEEPNRTWTRVEKTYIELKLNRTHQCAEPKSNPNLLTQVLVGFDRFGFSKI